MDSEVQEGEAKATSTTTKTTPDVDVKSHTDNSSSPLSLSLHDCVALGEIEVGLKIRQRDRLGEKGGIDNDVSRREEEYLRSEEVQRLPYLLRLLSSTRPLASIQPFVTSKSKLKDEKDVEETSGSIETSTNDNDEYLDRIVDRLEDVAANYSVAGGIDVVTNHLAPSVAKSLSRLDPLVKTRVDDGYKWNTSGLATVARDPIAKRKRRRKEAKLGSKNKKTKQENDGETGTAADDALGASSDEDQEGDPMDIELEELTNDRRESFIRRDSMLVAAEDSQESTVVKTVSELTSLIVASLDNSKSHEVEGDDDQRQHSGTSTGNRKALSLLTLETDDILSEKATSMSTSGHGGDGTMEGNDLSSTIVAIMHNAPVLRSRHVAGALCRASVPQAGDIIARLGANCPASVPSLLVGCIEAYSMSIEHHHQDDSDGFSSNNITRSKPNLFCPVVTAAKSAIAAVAKLSSNESCRVQTKLQSLGIMIDMQLKLALEEGSKTFVRSRIEERIIPISCLLIEHLSFPATSEIQSNEKTSVSTSSKERTKSEGGQTPGDINTDSTYHEQVLRFATACSKSAEPSLLLHFVLSEDLYVQTLNCFSHMLKEGATQGGIKTSQGKWSLIFRAFALLLLVPLSNSTASSDSALSSSYKACVKSFSALVQGLSCSTGNEEKGRSVDRPKKSKMDTMMGLLSSCGVLLLSQNLSSGDSAQNRQVMRTMLKVLHSTSETSDMLRISIEGQVRTNDTWGVFKRVLHPLEMTSSIEQHYANYCYNTKQIELAKFCEVMRPSLEDMKDSTELDLSFMIPFRLGMLRKDFHSQSELLVEETKKFLHNILTEDDENKGLSLMSTVESAQFVIEATNFLVKSGSSEVPLVLQAHLDLRWSKIASMWNISDATPTTGLGYIFLLQLMYALVFLDKSPKSPFAFDPRSSPIKEALVMVQKIPSESTRKYLLSEIQCLLQSHYPEMNRFEFEEFVGRAQLEYYGTLNRKSILASLCGCIRKQIRENNPHCCKNKTEKLFVQAKPRICDSELYSAIANAFLSSDHAPSPTYSYHLMCRDPIVCLKFPLSVWKCRTLRRIALSTLENLLTANNAIALKESRFEETASEVLAARDAIVVRCLLSLMHGGDSKNMMICSTTTNFIRWLICSNSGLVALLVKQGLKERDLDWLIENVPEIMNDSRHLLKIFSERNGLTTAERLVAADAVIRVAIAHGESNEVDASQLILTAVSQLVDSFYLVLGPVGLLPVDALFTAESGTPITQISQKAAFRMLQALTKLKGINNHIRRDCSMILQKLISLCKQELQGTAVGRRKQLVKEMYDAAMKVEK